MFAVHNTCSEDSTLAYFDHLPGGFIEVANTLNAEAGEYAPSLRVYLLPHSHDLFDCKLCEYEPWRCLLAEEVTRHGA